MYVHKYLLSPVEIELCRGLSRDTSACLLFNALLHCVWCNPGLARLDVPGQTDNVKMVECGYVKLLCYSIPRQTHDCVLTTTDQVHRQRRAGNLFVHATSAGTSMVHGRGGDGGGSGTAER